MSASNLDLALTQIERSILNSRFSIIDAEEVPGIPPVLMDLPDGLHPHLQTHLRQTRPRGVYGHQASALESFLRGEDLCLATSTASGKSLVFMAAAVEMLLREGSAKVLAFYPVRALIQDQIEKWQEMLSPFGFKAGFIDGGVATPMRARILESSNVVLMTPDVAHAWLMARQNTWSIVEFMSALGLLILDEAHVYDGVFGTNSAYLFRRLAAAAPEYRLIASTATLGDPGAFVRQLTGRATVVFGSLEDAAGRQPKRVLPLKGSESNEFECSVALLRSLRTGSHGRFLAFADSRKFVERMSAAVLRPVKAGEAEEAEDSEDVDDDDADHPLELDSAAGVLPYRAGYETDDRRRIQEALAQGGLAGVISTSALELGIDIGEIGTVVLLDLPPTHKSLWQRIGRAGRTGPGVCLIIDRAARLATTGQTLAEYLRADLEPNWLYLENRFIQYAHALCAARECVDRAEATVPEALQSLPEGFVRRLANELDQTESVSNDLYVLKQRGEASPHWEFPLRTCTEQSFRVTGPANRPLGELDFGHALREAYPGGVYYYMGRPYRVFAFRQREGAIRVRKAAPITTQPAIQAMAFPNFRGGLLNLKASNEGFVAEVELQVSERVLGFIELRGRAQETFTYGPESDYYSRPINRFFQTTGVCWFLPHKGCCSEAVANGIREAFGIACSVQARDLGVGLFHAKQSPIGAEKCHGICVYDLTYGSLRLTEKLALEFGRVVQTAAAIAERRSEHAVAALLRLVLDAYRAMTPRPIRAEDVMASGDQDWVDVVAEGSSAMLLGTDGAEEVTVRTARYTPQGLMYELVPPKGHQRRLVRYEYVQPIHGESATARFNMLTGEMAE